MGKQITRITIKVIRHGPQGEINMQKTYCLPNKNGITSISLKEMEIWGYPDG